MAPNHRHDALMACDELTALFARLRPAAEYRTLLLVRSLARTFQGDAALKKAAERLQVLSGMFLSERKHAAWPGGAEGLRAEIVDGLLVEIRTRVQRLQDQQPPGDGGMVNPPRCAAPDRQPGTADRCSPASTRAPSSRGR